MLSTYLAAIRRHNSIDLIRVKGILIVCIELEASKVECINEYITVWKPGGFPGMYPRRGDVNCCKTALEDGLRLGLEGGHDMGK